MSGIEVGFLPTKLFDLPAKEWRRILRKGESSELDHIALGDHVSFFVGMGFDALIGASAVLASTERINVNTAVYLLPLRQPVLVARQIADLSSIAPGRFTFGVGIGGEDPHELQICGIDAKDRGRRMNECIEIVRGLATGESMDFEGEFFQLEQAQIQPPLDRAVPIVVGGRSEAAIRRAGLLGDGWFGIWVSAARYAKVLEQMRSVADAAGRPNVEWRNALNVWVGVGDSAEEARQYIAPRMQQFYQTPYERFERWSPAGTPEQIADFLLPYAEAGCHVFNLIACGGSAEAEIDAVADIRRLMRTGLSSTSSDDQSPNDPRESAKST
jgi:alkanesulfonate monooxygenase SsuD/methylene tetrahydromethanopterin reductase-like flavin-dependent oxidoreductase (luciferase family)